MLCFGDSTVFEHTVANLTENVELFESCEVCICAVGSLTNDTNQSLFKHDKSGEDVTGHEIFGFVDIFAVDCANELANIPEEIFLKDTLTSDAEFFAKCIKTRFCGVGLPTTVKDCHRSVINHCNLVAMEIHSRHTVVGNNLGVA